MAKIRVPQADGDIRISTAGDEPKTYRVTDHVITVAADDVLTVLVAVDGARPADDKAKDAAAS